MNITVNPDQSQKICTREMRPESIFSVVHWYIYSRLCI